MVSSTPSPGEKAGHSERIYLLSKEHTAQSVATLIVAAGRSKLFALVPRRRDGRRLTAARKDHAPANFATLRRIAPSIIKANSAEGSNRGTFKRPGWSKDFLKTLVSETRSCWELISVIAEAGVDIWKASGNVSCGWTAHSGLAANEKNVGHRLICHQHF